MTAIKGIIVIPDLTRLGEALRRSLGRESSISGQPPWPAQVKACRQKKYLDSHFHGNDRTEKSSQENKKIPKQFLELPALATINKTSSQSKPEQFKRKKISKP